MKIKGYLLFPGPRELSTGFITIKPRQNRGAFFKWMPIFAKTVESERAVRLNAFFAQNNIGPFNRCFEALPVRDRLQEQVLAPPIDRTAKMKRECIVIAPLMYLLASRIV